MVSFDHRDAGTSEPDWAGSPRWRETRIFDGRPRSAVVIVAAHPDDETLGAGGLISKLAASGCRIDIVLATRGEQSHVRAISAARLGEFTSAMARLAPHATVHDLRLPDGGLREHAKQLEAALVSVIGDDTDLVVSPWRGDGHRDHRIAGEVAASVSRSLGIELLEYPIWLWHWGAPDSREVPWQDFVRLPLSVSLRKMKAEALAAYLSQTTAVDEEAPILHPGMLAHFAREWETFVSTPA